MLLLRGICDVDTAGAAPWRFVATCDSRGSSSLQQVNTNVLREIALAAVEESADLVVFAGDLIYGYPGVETAFREWTNAMAPAYEAGIGVYPVRGNHDVGAGWHEVLGHGLPTNGPPNEVGMTYAFTNRNALFLGLDNYSGSLVYYNAPIAVHTAWVDQQLASNTLPHVFAYGHSPAFKVRHYDCLDDVPAQRDAFWHSLTAAGAKAYFCGHDHFYDHSRLDDGDGNPVNDVHQIVAGTAGAPLYDRAPYDGYNGVWTPVHMFYDKVHGYVVVEIDGSRATLTWKRRAAPGHFVAAETFSYDVSADSPRTRYVSPHGAHQPPYDDWATAATNIQAAVSAAVDWDVVLVTNGTYDSGSCPLPDGVVSRVAVPCRVEVRSVNGSSSTAIVGQGPAGSNAVRCAYLSGNARLVGFTLRGGHTQTNGSVNLAMSGAGVWCEGNGTVEECVITANRAEALGGGAYLAGGRLLNCVVHGNVAQHGGGVFCWQGFTLYDQRQRCNGYPSGGRWRRASLRRRYGNQLGGAAEHGAHQCELACAHRWFHQLYLHDAAARGYMYHGAARVRGRPRRQLPSLRQFPLHRSRHTDPEQAHGPGRHAASPGRQRGWDSGRRHGGLRICPRRRGFRW